jgi:hypothetical protein
MTSLCSSLNSEEGRKNFFFEKKKQKTFGPLRGVVGPGRAK